MRLIITGIVMALALPVFAAQAQQVIDEERYFTPHERTSPQAIGVGSIDGRYPRPMSSIPSLNIPNGAGAPVPLDPFLIGGRYHEGETALPFSYQVRDAKGRATNDIKERSAWDGTQARMTYGN